MILKEEHFALENFEGPLDFLLHLIQKDEIDIYDVPIQELILQFLNKLEDWQAKWDDKWIDHGAEFISMAAYLVWFKSKMLLPPVEQPLNEEEIAEDPNFEIIHHLLDYCRFKQAAKDLSLRHEEQQSHYTRALPRDLEFKKPLGIHHLSLNELESLFNTLISRAKEPAQQLQGESWRVSDKITLIRHSLQKEPVLTFENLFFSHQCRLEIIVTFLAILELMKLGEICVQKNLTTSQIQIGKNLESVTI